MENWQDLAFSTRHYHNRLSRGAAGGSGKNRHGSQFNIRRIFGRYEVICAAARKSQQVHSVGPDNATACLDILRFSRGDTGLRGRLVIPGVLDADVILAGSRKILQELVDHYSNRDDGSCPSPLPLDVIASSKESKSVEGEQSSDIRGSDTPRVLISERGLSKGGTCHTRTNYHDRMNDLDGGDHFEDDHTVDENTEEEELQVRRHNAFEKNSFRNPKFWFQWTGQVSMLGENGVPTEEETACQTGGGYVVFSGHDCKTFKGTITVDSLQWKDTAMTGRRLAHMAERDDHLHWFKDTAFKTY